MLKFLKMSLFYCGVNPYNFKSLTEKWVEFDITFYKLLNNDIDGPELLS